MFLIQEGNSYDFPLKLYYAESDDEIDEIPANAPAGTIVEVNEQDNFHVMMKMLDGSWNLL